MRCASCGHQALHHAVSIACSYRNLNGMECGCPAFAVPPPKPRLYSMDEVLTEAVAVFFRLTGAGVSELATFQETLRRALESPPSGRGT